MLAFLREVAFICASNDCMVRAVHLPGIDNRLADLLSRRSSLRAEAEAQLVIDLRGWTCRSVKVSDFACRSNW